MFKVFYLCFITILMILVFSLPNAAVVSGAAGSGCRGTIVECLAYSEEFELDSEVSRRILATSRYISYGALTANYVPCSRRSASYYNCPAGGKDNPYTRGPAGAPAKRSARRCRSVTHCRI